MNYQHLIKEAIVEIQKDIPIDWSMYGSANFNESVLKQGTNLKDYEWIEAVDERRRELDKQFNTESKLGDTSYEDIVKREDPMLKRTYSKSNFSNPNDYIKQNIDLAARQRLMNEIKGDKSHIYVANKNKIALRTIQNISEGTGGIEGMGDPRTLDGKLKQIEVLENRGNKLFNAYQQGQFDKGNLITPEAVAEQQRRYPTTKYPVNFTTVSSKVPGKWGKILRGGAALAGAAGLGAAGSAIADKAKKYIPFWNADDQALVKEVVQSFLRKDTDTFDLGNDDRRTLLKRCAISNPFCTGSYWSGDRLCI